MHSTVAQSLWPNVPESREPRVVSCTLDALPRPDSQAQKAFGCVPQAQDPSMPGHGDTEDFEILTTLPTLLRSTSQRHPSHSIVPFRSSTGDFGMRPAAAGDAQVRRHRRSQDARQSAANCFVTSACHKTSLGATKYHM